MVSLILGVPALLLYLKVSARYRRISREKRRKLNGM